jgi:pimeloyl-ACP methyl ester carboxylesterase
MPNPRPTRRTVLAGAAATAVATAVAAGVVTPADAAEPAGKRPSGPRPTVVLVHGAFADASGWAPTIDKLHADGYPVFAVANPLRSLAGDAAYLKAVLAPVTGPIILVGHSYGGALITNAATGNPNVKALVYIAGFAPDEGESAFQLSEGGSLPDVVAATEVPVPGGGTDTELAIRPEEYHKAFITEVSDGTARTMAATQRPITLTALGSPSGPPAWKMIPSWYAVFAADRAIPPASQRTMASRARARTVEIPGASHGYFIRHPHVVVDLIRAAARTTR